MTLDATTSALAGFDPALVADVDSATRPEVSAPVDPGLAQAAWCSVAGCQRPREVSGHCRGHRAALGLSVALSEALRAYLHSLPEDCDVETVLDAGEDVAHGLAGLLRAQFARVSFDPQPVMFDPASRTWAVRFVWSSDLTADLADDQDDDEVTQAVETADTAKRRRLERGLAPGARQHGSVTGYGAYGCRCSECTEANRAACRQRAQRKRGLSGAVSDVKGSEDQ